MANEPEQIRLPELPLFKRYSLALRQEFASAEEVATVLERTSAKLEELIEKAERKAREELERVDDDHDPLPDEVQVDQAEDDLPDDKPFWETADTAPPPPRKVPRKVPSPPKANVAKPAARKTKAAGTKSNKRHSVVPVGHHGRPLGQKPKAKAAPKPKAAPRSKSKAAPKAKPKPKPAARGKKASSRGSRRR